MRTLIIGALAVAGVAMARPAFAQATIEFYGENGTNPPPLTAPVGLNWFGGGNSSWFEATDGNTPEGAKYQSFTNQNGVVGFWGFQFFNYGTSQVVQQDLSAYAGGQVRFLLKSNADLALQLEWGTSSNAALSIPSTGGQWKEIAVDLSLFVSQGMDLSHVRVPFLIKNQVGATNASTWLVDHIRWTKQLKSIDVIPVTTFQTIGRHRQYTAVGRDSVGDEVVIYCTWTVTGAGNSVSPTPTSRYTVLTIGSGSGNLQAYTTNAWSGVSTFSANVPVNPGPAQDTTLGLLSETIPGLIFGTDSDFGVYHGGSDSITTADNTTDFREGTKSTQVTMNVTSGGYAGFFIQAGVSGSAETVTRNMADYYDGSIRFWLKAPAALSGLLNLSIRTGGVGTELSKIALTNGSFGVQYDNNWHPVVIPVAQFAKAVPFAELSTIKILFNMSVTANTGGAQTFYIDNLRWDTQTPGALSYISVKPMGNTSQRVRIPKSLKRSFIARGFDANNVEVDLYPNWTLSGAIGSLSALSGQRTRLDAAATPALGSITATDPGTGISTTTYIDVADVTFTQSFNVYSDAGSGGQIGVDQSGGSMNIQDSDLAGAPEGSKVMHATYTVTGANAYATWFDYEPTGSRFMSGYSDGYLHFWVRTGHDLEISIRSANIPSGNNNAKFRLSDLGVPTDNTWQEVWLSLDDFKLQDSRLDFSQMVVYWGIAAIQSETGDQSNQLFDVDDVKWYTADPHVPDVTKVYQGVKDKQNPTTGLVLTFSNDSTNRAVTYDQALAAMTYTYHQDTLLAQKVLDVFKTKYNNGTGFAGFNNEYDRDNPTTIRNYDRQAGPNAWIMLAALHYKAATGSTTYDGMITGIANWLLTLQDTDGGIKLGYLGNPGTLNNAKSTEHNFDVYAAFRAYKSITGLGTYESAANKIFTWLTTSSTAGTNPGAWNAVQQRFNAGRDSAGVANTDYALDCYSWAPLALTSTSTAMAPYINVVTQAEGTFGTTHTIDVNGISMTGFDFSSVPGNGTTIPYGQPVDKDAVWVEGTAHMVLAYLEANDATRANTYLNEIDKAVYTVGTSSQALNYASNAGTAYWTGSLMDSTHAALSSMCWYLFAKAGFNPLQPAPLYGVVVKSISNNLPAPNVTWTVNVPARWTRADQYVELQAQPIDTRPWGVQIYTDNTNRAAMSPYFQDPTPANTSNLDSDPAGLLESLPGATTTQYTLTMGWKIQDSTAPTPGAVQPFSVLDHTGDPTWLFFKDKASPAIDTNNNGTTTDPVDSPAFTPGMTYATVKTNSGIQTASGSFFPSLNPDYLFIESDFGTASAQTPYRANIILEYFIQ